MTRRNLVILILVLVAAAVLWQRTLRKQKDPGPQASAVSSEPEKPSSQKNSQTSASESREVPSRETAVAEMQPRQVREPRVQVRAKGTNTANAQLQNSALFADTSWKVWNGVSAILQKNGRPQKNVIGEVNGYYLIEDGFLSNSSQFSASQPLVVFDTRLDTVGVVTGVFTVVLRNGVSADIFGQMPEVKVINEFPNISTYYVTAAKEPFDLQAFKEFLRTEPGVAEVQPEILSRQYEKY